MRRALTGGLAAALALATAPAAAIDGMAVEIGRGHGTDMARVAVQWDMKQRWFESGDWFVGSFWDAGLGYWHRSAAPGQNEDITEIGVTPVLRFQKNSQRGLFFDAGIGAHLLSRSQIGDKRLGTLFQFGSHIGVGFRFGDKGQYDLGYRYQHLSNGGIKQPNNGINFSQVRLQYHF